VKPVEYWDDPATELQTTQRDSKAFVAAQNFLTLVKPAVYSTGLTRSAGIAVCCFCKFCCRKNVIVMSKPTTDIFNSLQGFTEPPLRDEIIQAGTIIKAGAGDVLIREGQYLDFLPLVIHGLLRVYRNNDDDREILLYYVQPGQTCMMSLSSAYFDYYSAANGIAVEPSGLLILPARLISEWQLKYPSWNRFILTTYKSRYDELLNAFGNVAFKPINARIQEYLRNYARQQHTQVIPLSHQTLANELGTTRVVVSRILKDLEKEKVLKLSRGSIALLA
jgi:CRP/FNR family transcriptional regulator